MAASSTTWYLTIRKGPQAGSTYALRGGTLTIGRQAENQIAIDDPMVSRRHARLTWRSGAFYVEDLGSANGTWVNNQRISGSVALCPGDVIGLGQEVLLLFGDRAGGDATIHEASARAVAPPAAADRPAAAPTAVPPAAPAAPEAAGGRRGWLAFGLGGFIAILGIGALAIVGVAIYLLAGAGSPGPTSEAALPSSTPISAVVPNPTDTQVATEAPTATPYPTYTPYPTTAATPTPYPTYTPFPTSAPTATPYPTYTPYPTSVPTATPYPTYTPYPTATFRPNPTQQPTDGAPEGPSGTPAPTAAALAPFTVTLGRNVVYEPWGRPRDAGGCQGPYDDESPVRRFTVEVILTNNSNRFIPDYWMPTFISATGRPLPSCIWYYNNTAVQPDETVDVTFATHLETDDWVTAIIFDELNYTATICLGPSGQMLPCQ